LKLQLFITILDCLLLSVTPKYLSKTVGTHLPGSKTSNFTECKTTAKIISLETGI